MPFGAMACASRVDELALPDHKWNGQQRTKKQKDQDARSRRNPEVACSANDTYEDPDRSGYTASLRAPRTDSWQQEKHEKPEHTHGCARERRIDENGISKSRRD